MKRNYIVIPSTDAALQFLEKITRFIFLFVKKREDCFGCIKPAVDVANQYIFIYPFWSSFSTLLLNCYYHETFQFFLSEGNFLLKFEDMEIKNFFFIKWMKQHLSCVLHQYLTFSIHCFLVVAVNSVPVLTFSVACKTTPTFWTMFLKSGLYVFLLVGQHMRLKTQGRSSVSWLLLCWCSLAASDWEHSLAL